MFQVSDDAILNCTHEHMRPVRRIDGSGHLKVYLQCPVCGHGGSAMKKAGYDLDALPWWDEEIIARREAVREGARLKKLAEWVSEGDRWETWYHEVYLNSEEWKHVKRRAHERDGWRCQNCFQHVNEYTARAHHIMPWGYHTLRATGHTLTFELVTLCVRCHTLAHPEKRR